MEVLLLDTTEKEGEDNTLYHYVHSSDTAGCFSTTSRTNTTHWLDLRGVLAAAVGATTSLCGEPLKFARFGNGDSNGSTGIVGFVNIYEVLYALVFTSPDIPEAIVQYYTRSSCDLLLSLLGYPDAKLGQWRRRDGSSVSMGTLSAQLDTIFRGICSVIHKDLSFGSHLHFAFDGRVPAVNYPLEIMAKLAVLDSPFGDTTTSTQKYTAIGRCVFYRKQLVFSTMRSDFLRMFFQWLLAGDQFAPDSSVTEPPRGNGDGSPTRIDTFELHDFRFTRHGGYPKRHALLIITKGYLQLVFLIERKLEFEGTDDAVEWAKTLSDDVNQQSVEEVFTFCKQHLEAYLETTQTLRQERVEALQTQCAEQLHREPLDSFLWYSVALDHFRGVIIGDVLPFTHLDAQDQRIKSQQQNHDSILARFVQHIVALQQSTRCMHGPITPETSPELPSGIRPLKLNVDDPDTLFLREKPTDEGDISTGDAHVFPELQYTQASYENKGRQLRQTAERVFVQGHPFWIIATYFETLEFFSILDAALPLELLEHEMNRLCAFGGADPATTSEPDK